jgi:hypothetical protein
LRQEKRSVFLSFGFEAVSVFSKRFELMKRILEFFDVYTAIEEETRKSDLNFEVFPNPASGWVELRYELPEPAEQRVIPKELNISFFDIVGKKLDEWKSSGLHPGMNNRSWDLSEWPSGIYFVQLKIGNSSSMKKIVICK